MSIFEMLVLCNCNAKTLGFIVRGMVRSISRSRPLSARRGVLRTSLLDERGVVGSLSALGVTGRAAKERLMRKVVLSLCMVICVAACTSPAWAQGALDQRM